ncbi:MAG: hypothetical protein JWO78_378 [Micavibrio sp.]|nr:hypothetical protein [Micavibrio sp.]
MKRTLKSALASRAVASLVLAGAVFAILAGSSHEAKADTKIYFGFGNPAPVVYTQPRVIYNQPRPVYYRPAPVYYTPVQQVVYRPSWDNNHGWDRNRYDHHGRGHGNDHGHR